LQGLIQVRLYAQNQRLGLRYFIHADLVFTLEAQTVVSSLSSYWTRGDRDCSENAPYLFDKIGGSPQRLLAAIKATLQ